MAGDAYYSQCVLRLHCDGANNATTFTDSSITPKTGTANGNAKLSTTRPKFGTAAGEFDGTGDYVQFANSADFSFGSGDFTISGWFETDTITGAHAIIGYANGSAANSNYSFQIIINGSTLSASLFFGSTAYSPTKSGVAIGTKHHWALERYGNNLTIYLDGVGGTPVDVTGVTANNPSSSILQIGQVQGYYPWDGSIDELDIVKGAARYQGDFTPPAAALLDGIGQVSGTVRDDTGALCARTVRIYRRDTGALIGSTTSDASLGTYTINCPTLDEVQRIVLDDSGGTLYNDLVDRVIPA